MCIRDSDWYLTLTPYPTDSALKHKAEVFSPVLLRALKGYYETESKSNWHTVGLDFDPILNTQEPSEV